MLLTKILSTLATNHIKLIGLIDANRIAVRKIMHRNDDDKSQKFLGSDTGACKIFFLVK